MTYIIEDWAGNVLFDGKEFYSFEDGWDHICVNVNEPDGDYGDYYVVEKGKIEESRFLDPKRPITYRNRSVNHGQ